MKNNGTSGLNPAQDEAVHHDGGHLLVLAGAGTGKTRVITRRIARLLCEDISPEQLLALTFTNKAAAEMRERVERLVGSAAQSVWMLTFHALGLAILREEYKAVGLAKNFCIYDTADQLSLVRELLRRKHVADRRLDVPRVLTMILEAKRAGQKEVPILDGDDYELAANLLYTDYIEHMRSFHAVDFDDLIARARAALQKPEVAARWCDRFRHILVDEYQDTSPDQLAFLKQLAGENCSVFAVGDDDQSIYAWRGADARSILQFDHAFPGAHEVVLDQNYRSTTCILDAANNVIRENSRRKEKNLWSEFGHGDAVQVVACADGDDEAAFVADTVHILHHEGLPYADMAVLYRSNTQARAFEESLALEHIPFKVFGGQSFYERKEVRDAMAYLAAATNPRDEISLRRIINVPARGLGPTSVEKLAQAGKGNGGLWGALQHADAVAKLPSRSQPGARALGSLLASLRQDAVRARGESLGDVAKSLFKRLELRDHILASGDPPNLLQRRLRHLDEVVDSLRRFGESNPTATLFDYMRNMALLRDKDEESADGHVSLMTIHSAKGLEFHTVIVAGCEEDLLPHRRSVEEGTDLDEERRLMYVAMTRAKRKLYLSRAATRRMRGALTPRTPSRFLDAVEQTDNVETRDRAAEENNPIANDAQASEFFAKMQEMLAD